MFVLFEKKLLVVPGKLAVGYNFRKFDAAVFRRPVGIMLPANGVRQMVVPVALATQADVALNAVAGS